MAENDGIVEEIEASEEDEEEVEASDENEEKVEASDV